MNDETEEDFKKRPAENAALLKVVLKKHWNTFLNSRMRAARTGLKALRRLAMRVPYITNSAVSPTTWRTSRSTSLKNTKVL